MGNQLELIRLFSALKCANLESIDVFPWSGTAQGLLKRWRLPIPVKINGIERFEKALDRIESEIGLVLFDRKTIEGLQDSGIVRGIIASEGTALGRSGSPEKNGFGHVSESVRETKYPKNFLNNNGTIDCKIYVHLGSELADDQKAGECASDIAVHEIGHAIGISGKHNGIEGDDIIFESFWAILKIIYRCEKSTPRLSDIDSYL